MIRIIGTKLPENTEAIELIFIDSDGMVITMFGTWDFTVIERDKFIEDYIHKVYEKEIII